MMSAKDDPSIMEDDFAKLFEESERENSVSPGEVVKGEVVEIANGMVTVDIGYKSEGQVPLQEFSSRGSRVSVQVGDLVEVYFEGSDADTGTVSLSRIRAEQVKVWGEVERAFEAGEPVEGLIVGKVKGGLKVDVGVAAFLPGSHADLRPTRSLERFIGQRGRFAVLKFNRARGNVVVSRRAVLEKERDALKEETLRVLEEGIILEGTVKNITDYGAFVEIEKGVEGLIHVSEMSWTKRVTHPSKVLEIGAEGEVQVLDVDPTNRRISLGLKQVEPNPWERVRLDHPVGSHIKGAVKSITDFGVFVEVEEGIDGLIHVSDISWTRTIRHPSEVYRKGEEVEAIVLGVDVANERISLGVKQLGDDPWESLEQRHPVGSRVRGPITSVTDFGIFLKIEEGVEGLVHVSQLSHERIDRPGDHFHVGTEVEAEITSIDLREKKIGLSVKALRHSEERAEMDAYMRRDSGAGRFSLGDVLPEKWQAATPQSRKGDREDG